VPKHAVQLVFSPCPPLIFPGFQKPPQTWFASCTSMSSIVHYSPPKIHLFDDQPRAPSVARAPRNPSFLILRAQVFYTFSTSAACSPPTCPPCCYFPSLVYEVVDVLTTPLAPPPGWSSHRSPLTKVHVTHFNFLPLVCFSFSLTQRFALTH